MENQHLGSVSMEVIVTVVCRLAYSLFQRRKQPTYNRGYKYQQDILVRNDIQLLDDSITIEREQSSINHENLPKRYL